MISFDCQCGKPFRFSLKFIGRPFRCNVCGRPLIVPDANVAHTSEKTVATVVGDIITPVKPILAIDLDSLPKAIAGSAPRIDKDVDDFDDDTPINGISYNKEDETVSDDEDDLVLTGNITQIDDVGDFHVDLALETQDHTKPKPTDVIVEAPPVAGNEQAPKKKGWFSSKKKEPKAETELSKPAKKPEKVKPVKEKKVKPAKVQQPAAQTGDAPVKKSQNIGSLVLIVVLLLATVVFAGLWMLEKGSTKTEREKATQFENQANEFRQKYNTLVKEQEVAKQPEEEPKPEN